MSPKHVRGTAKGSEESAGSASSREPEKKTVRAVLWAAASPSQHRNTAPPRSGRIALRAQSASGSSGCFPGRVPALTKQGHEFIWDRACRVTALCGQPRQAPSNVGNATACKHFWSALERLQLQHHLAGGWIPSLDLFSDLADSLRQLRPPSAPRRPRRLERRDGSGSGAPVSQSPLQSQASGPS